MPEKYFSRLKSVYVVEGDFVIKLIQFFSVGSMGRLIEKLLVYSDTYRYSYLAKKKAYNYLKEWQCKQEEVPEDLILQSTHQKLCSSQLKRSRSSKINYMVQK